MKEQKYLLHTSLIIVFIFLFVVLIKVNKLLHLTTNNIFTETNYSYIILTP